MFVYLLTGNLTASKHSVEVDFKFRVGSLDVLFDICVFIHGLAIDKDTRCLEDVEYTSEFGYCIYVDNC
jgi:hypothetical protein